MWSAEILRLIGLAPGIATRMDNARASNFTETFTSHGRCYLFVTSSIKSGNCHTRNRVIRCSFCAAAIQGRACLLRHQRSEKLDLSLDVRFAPEADIRCSGIQRLCGAPS